jgi:hypothetical protein
MCRVSLESLINDQEVVGIRDADIKAKAQGKIN